MKRILLAVMFGIGALGFAQSEKEIVQKYIVDKIKGYKPTDLVPYSKGGRKWALMDVKSRKILTGFVLGDPETFKPKLSIDMDFKRYIIGRVDSDYIIELESRRETLPPEIGYEKYEKINKPAFQMDETGEITVSNPEYKYILDIVSHKGVYYAVVSKKDNSWALINEKGEEQKGFYFKKISNIGYKDKESGEDVFNVEDFDGKKGLITILGKKKLYGELMNNFTKYKIVLGYVVQKDNDYPDEIKKSGVVDLVTQEWLIKPQEKYKIYDIIYTSSEELKKSDVTNRNKATVYFLATDQSGQHFVLDIKGNPILPKE